MRLRLKNLNKIRDNKYWINKERERGKNTIIKIFEAIYFSI